MSAADELILCTGSQTSGNGDGISLIPFYYQEERLQESTIHRYTVNPTFLTTHPSLPMIYAVQESDNWCSFGCGGVTAMRYMKASDHAVYLRQVSWTRSVGTHPCHVSVDCRGRYLAVSNYGDGVLAVFRLEEDGTIIDEPLLIDRHSGSGPVKERQEQAHLHSASFDDSGDHLYACDLGCDTISVYAVTDEHIELQRTVSAAPGSGPRHCVIDPTGSYLYCIYELSNEVGIYERDPKTGDISFIESISTRDKGADGFSKAAEIRMSCDGRHLYCTNRGDDTIAWFTREPSKGSLHLEATIPSGGKRPRNIILDPTERYLFCANASSDTITTFRRDPESGSLEQFGEDHFIGEPMAMVIL